MENKNLDEVIQMLYGYLGGKCLSHEDLIIKIKELTILPKYCNLSSSDINNIVFEYEKRYGSKTFVPGTTLVSKEASDTWFHEKKRKMTDEEHSFENRYKKYLMFERFGENAIKKIIEDTEKVLSLCADPESNEKRRGLVMGDVQSGKTSNYLALANMAYDYGYKIVLILAGMTDSLRIQTQERVDEGLIGAISSTIEKKEVLKYIGVGINECRHYCVPLTTNEHDFSAMAATSNDFNKPLVLVVKKNKSILTNLKKWLKPGHNDISSRNILIIDDECDNASVNTKKQEDPSSINLLIREIYNNFNCASYVGFTATPFANIFINPEKNTINDDLFPSDFIHRLKAAPESYFGADKVFGEESSHLVVLNENERGFFDPKHKKNDVFPGLCESMKNAICDFLLCNCIRTFRGDKLKHRSMMFNITPYNDLHEDIKLGVENYIRKLQDIILQYDKYPIEKFIKDPEMNRLYVNYTNDDFYANCNLEISFDEIKQLLYDEISLFKVAIINNKYVGDKRFNYDNYKETGARVIMIGGYVLSRGLTLKGLMTSYYSRNASAYDTLLQMCRWFGYRPNHEDLCRVYMSQISIDSFGAVIDAIENLDEQLRIMNVQGKEPKDFGLMVQESPDRLETKLIITARNKMKSTKVVNTFLNYSGECIDTSKLFVDYKHNDYNTKQLESFYKELENNGFSLVILNKRRMFVDVLPSLISKFIRSLHIPLENKKFDAENIANFIEEAKYYDKWDVVFATGNERQGKEKFKLFDLEIDPIERKFEYRTGEEIVRISKNNNRLIEPGIFDSGLDSNQLEEAKKSATDRAKANKKEKVTLIARDYLSVKGRKPLLVILPIKLTCDKNDSDEDKIIKEEVIQKFNGKYLIGIGIGFAGKDEKVMMTYKINLVKYKELMNKYNDEEEEEND